MLVDISHVILDEKNNPIIDGVANLTLKEVIVRALLGYIEAKDGDVKAKRFASAMKVQSATGTVELTAEEISEAKKCIGGYFITLIVGRAYQLIEQKVDPSKVYSNSK